MSEKEREREKKENRKDIALSLSESKLDGLIIYMLANIIKAL